MNRRKEYLIAIMIFIFSLCTMNVSAAFDVDSTAASYDSNTGWLIIYDNEFTDENSNYTQRFKTTFSKIKLGNMPVKGNAYFNDGFVKVVLTNSCREEINKNQDFIQTHLVTNQLILEDGAFVKTYTPPGGINVVVDSYSRKKVLDVNVKGLKPKMKVSSFTSSKSTIENSGGNVSFYVNGDNLDIASFYIKKDSFEEKYDLDVIKSRASTTINILENKNNQKRVDTFVLYINNVETDKKIDITVQPSNRTQDDTTDIENDKTPLPENNDNSNNINDSNANITKPDQGNNITYNNSNTPVDNNESNSSNVITERDNQSDSSNNKDIIDNSNIIEDKIDNHKKVSDNKQIDNNKSNNFSYILLGCLSLFGIVFSKVLYDKYKK